MEVYQNNALREDRQLLLLTHLSQLLSLFTGFGGIVAPLILWLTQRDKIEYMDEQGKEIMNFQISMFIYAILCIPFIFIIIGVLPLIAIALLTIIFPIINAVKVNNGEQPHYPLSIKFIS